MKTQQTSCNGTILPLTNVKRLIIPKVVVLKAKVKK
jgi:hypothetical protein